MEKARIKLFLGGNFRYSTSVSDVIPKKVGVFECGFRPPAQRALWLGEIADCGIEN